MSQLNNEKISKFILWKEIFSIPVYTILFNYFEIWFWIAIVIDRLLLLSITCRFISIDKILEEVFESGNSSLTKLAIFSATCSFILYILIFINNREVFYILIACEIADYIVNKVLSK